MKLTDDSRMLSEFDDRNSFSRLVSGRPYPINQTSGGE